MTDKPILARLWVGSELVDVNDGHSLISPPTTFKNELEALAYIKRGNLPIVIVQVRSINQG